MNEVLLALQPIATADRLNIAIAKKELPTRAVKPRMMDGIME